MTPLQTPRADIKALDREALASWLDEHGIASFRAGQILKWIYRRQADGFDEMTDVGKELRLLLSENFVISRLEKEQVRKSRDGSVKFLFRLLDGHRIETVLIPEKKHYTLCVSSQAGCALGCRFCRTGQGGLQRNLTAGEIIAQIRDAAQQISPDDPLSLRNLVFMGMGEPLANYDSLIQSLKVITDTEEGMMFSTRRITVSTAGLVPRLRRLGAETDVNLAVSLNGADDETRSRLMPVNRKYPLEALISACEHYPLRPRRRITFEYILIRDVNDQPEQARKLTALLRPVRAKVNLIPFNEHPGSDFRRPDEAAILRFQKILTDAHYTAMIRYSKGTDISAACGQLSAEGK